jgi:hypothetical protein
MSKNFTIQLVTGLAIVCCLYTINATASTGDQGGESSSITLAVILGLVLIIGFKIISTNLKKVEKDLEDTFGENVLP